MGTNTKTMAVAGMLAVGGCIAGNDRGAGDIEDARGYDCGWSVQCEDEEPDWVWPTPRSTEVGNRFEQAIDYDQGCSYGGKWSHTGIDIAGEEGDPILAISDGVVVHVGPLWYDAGNSGRGPYAIIVEHDTGLYSIYSHNSAALVEFGDEVEAGEQIARMGNLGFSTTGDHVHLHLEVIDNPKADYTGDWERPFDLAYICGWYEDPLDYVEP